ncbi:Lrp/AsnC family transcriptional regulator [Paracoccaceae bacterium GXU_MW_L88]
MDENENPLDRIDRKILAALTRDGRLSMAALADTVGLSKTPVQARVKKLEAGGFIKGYTAILDHTKLGAGHVAFVQVSLTDTRSEALDAFSKAARETREIEECHMIAGGYDYLLKVRTAHIAGFRRFLGETLSAMPHVSHTTTFVAMETVKES